MENIKKRDLSLKLGAGSLDVIFARENTHESAVILSNVVKGAKGIIEFVNENNKIVYGVIYDVDDFIENNGNL